MTYEIGNCKPVSPQISSGAKRNGKLTQFDTRSLGTQKLDNIFMFAEKNVLSLRTEHGLEVDRPQLRYVSLDRNLLAFAFDLARLLK